MDHATGFLHARGRNRDLRLLDILNRVHEVVELKIHCGVVVALDIAQLYFGGKLCNVVGLREGVTKEYLDLLIDDLDVAINVVLREAFVEEIICDLPKLDYDLLSSIGTDISLLRLVQFILRAWVLGLPNPVCFVDFVSW